MHCGVQLLAMEGEEKMKVPDYCEGCNQRFAPIDQQLCWSCKDGDHNTSKRMFVMNKELSDEIKKGLECCRRRNSCRRKCQYDGPSHDIDRCTTKLAGDALAYIQRLESRLAQAERERDAAVWDLEHSAPCFACYYFHRNKGKCKGGMRCCDDEFKASNELSEYDGPGWKWRGVCP